MGKDLMDRFPHLRRIFDETDEICQRPISSLCLEGPMETLTLTENLQPAIMAVNLMCLRALQEAGTKPGVAVGHSLGEYAALVAASVVSETDGLRMVQKRGELMNREALAHPGAMAAVVGLPLEAVMDIVKAVKGDGVLDVANHNTAQQIVLTGEQEPVSRAVSKVKEARAKAIPLKVSGAWHSPLMAGGVKELREFMAAIPFGEPAIPVFFNATAGPETRSETIKDLMANQLMHPVRWYDIMVRLLEEGVQTFVEVGPGKVLAGLLKKIAPDPDQIVLLNVEDSRSLDQTLQRL